MIILLISKYNYIKLRYISSKNGCFVHKLTSVACLAITATSCGFSLPVTALMTVPNIAYNETYENMIIPTISNIDIFKSYTN